MNHIAPRLSRRVKLALVAGTSALYAGASSAAVDYSALTGAIDVDGVSTAIMTAAGLMVAVVVAIWGARKVIGFFR